MALRGGRAHRRRSSTRRSGGAVRELGYDRDFAALDPRPRRPGRPARPAPGWWRVGWDPATAARCCCPAGSSWTSAPPRRRWPPTGSPIRVAEAAGAGVLVSLGGDVRVGRAGPRRAAGGSASATTTGARHRPGRRRVHRPAAGWPHRARPAAPGGAPAGRAPHRRPPHRRRAPTPAGGRSPSPPRPASTPTPPVPPRSSWARRPRWLAERGLPARLVAADGAVVTTAGWPAPEEGS